MKNIEFYMTPRGGVMILDESGTRELTESNREFVAEMIEIIGEFWPEALQALSKKYDKARFNIPHYEFLIVRAFIKCNFPKFDSTMDIDHLGNFNFEEPECPMRGECPLEGVVCKPKYNSKLSSRELEVMKLYSEKMTEDEIAEYLFISPDTVRTHKRNAFKRVRVHTLAEFILYAKNNNLFNQ